MMFIGMKVLGTEHGTDMELATQLINRETELNIIVISILNKTK